jgi:hypothetical protein
MSRIRKPVPTSRACQPEPGTCTAAWVWICAVGSIRIHSTNGSASTVVPTSEM